MDSSIKATIISGVFLTITTVISSSFGYFQAKNRKLKIMTNLENHPYFSRVQAVKNEIKRTFQLPNKGKEVLFKDILFTNIDILVKRNLLLAQKIQKDEDKYKDTSILSAEHLKNLDDILNELCNHYECSMGYTADEKEVLRIVMSKYSVWSKDRIHNMQDQIMQTCNSPFYADSSASVKTSIILDQYLAFTLDLVHSASQTLDKINGDLRGLVYKGITI